MSPAETSGYLLMAGGLAWVLVGIVGLVGRIGMISTIPVRTSGEREMTTRLQKFIEIGSSGGLGRSAYVLYASALPRPAEGTEWQRIDSFSAAEEVLNDPGLKTVFKTAIENGFAVVEVEADEK
jgi:hypothetical protein